MAGLFQKSSNYVSVVYGDEDLRLAHVKRDASSCEVVNISKRDIRGIPEEELPKILKSALNEFNIKNPHSICIIPPSLTTTKNIEIPSINPEEIKSIINLQAGRHTPYSREEIIIDYINIGVFQKNYSKILLIIVNRNIIKKQLNILEEAGLKIEKIIFAPEAMARFYGRTLNLSFDDPPIGIIDIGNHSSDFIFGYRGTIVSCRSIPVGMIHLSTEGQAAKERLVGELKKSVEAYQNEDIEKVPETHLLSSDAAAVKELQPLIKESLKTTIKIVPYLDNLKISPSVRKSDAQYGGESFLDVIASGAMLSECQVDLLPEEVKLQRSIEAQSREVVKLGVLALLILMIFCGLFFIKIYVKENLLNQLKTNHSKQHAEADILQRITEKTGIIKDYFNNRMISLNTLDEIYKIVPDEIYLNSITLEENGSVTLQGTSESMSRVFTLVSTLEESALFKGVKTNSTTAKKERGKDVAAFELTFKLESAKDEEDKDASPENAKGKEKDKDLKKMDKNESVADKVAAKLGKEK